MDSFWCEINYSKKYLNNSTENNLLKTVFIESSDHNMDHLIKLLDLDENGTLYIGDSIKNLEPTDCKMSINEFRKKYNIFVCTAYTQEHGIINHMDLTISRKNEVLFFAENTATYLKPAKQ